MSYDQTAHADAKSESGHRHGHADPMGWAKKPGFNPMKALAVVAGFAIFPPLGIGALAWFVWNERRGRHAGPGFRSFDGDGRPMCGRGHRGWRTGNAAFDEHSAAVMNELAAERRAFFEHRHEERRKRDQQAFDAFQAKRAAKASDAGATE